MPDDQLHIASHPDRARPEAEDLRQHGSGRFSGKVALITAGSSGMGRAVAALFAGQCASVASGYLSEHRDAWETSRMVEAKGRSCLLRSGDIGNRNVGQRHIRKVVREWKALPGLVNNPAEQHPQETGDDFEVQH